MIATNLRAPITSVGPLVGTITNSLNLTGAQAGLITTLPLIAFAIISPIAPKLARKFGTETTILGALILIILGLSIRYLPSISTLFLGTAILGCGIAVGNVLIPSIVKQEFQNQSGLVTGIYSVSMNLTGAIASGVSIPLIEKLGWTWNQAFSLWIILAALALLAWLPQLKNKKATPEVNVVDTNNSIWHSSLA